MKEAIYKYGESNFIVELLCECNNQAELDSKEKYWIQYYREEVGIDNCYNISGGGLTIRSWNKGRKNVYSEETIKKMSDSASKRMKIPEERKRISNSLKGRPVPEERRRKIAQATKLAMNRPDVKAKLLDKNRHKGFTKGHEAWNKGKPAHNKGKKFNKELRRYE